MYELHKVDKKLNELVKMISSVYICVLVMKSKQYYVHIHGVLTCCMGMINFQKRITHSAFNLWTPVYTIAWSYTCSSVTCIQYQFCLVTWLLLVLLHPVNSWVSLTAKVAPHVEYLPRYSVPECYNCDPDQIYECMPVKWISYIGCILL